MTHTATYLDNQTRINAAFKGLAIRFISRHGEDYRRATDKWVLVRDWLVDQNIMGEDVADTVDEIVFTRLKL